MRSSVASNGALFHGALRGQKEREKRKMALTMRRKNEVKIYVSTFSKGIFYVCYLTVTLQHALAHKFHKFPANTTMKLYARSILNDQNKHIFRQPRLLQEISCWSREDAWQRLGQYYKCHDTINENRVQSNMLLGSPKIMQLLLKLTTCITTTNEFWNASKMMLIESHFSM